MNVTVTARTEVYFGDYDGLCTKSLFFCCHASDGLIVSCVFTCRGAERKRELHVLLKVLLDTPHPTSPCTINFIFGVLSRGSLAKQHDRKTVQNPEAQGGN